MTGSLEGDVTDESGSDREDRSEFDRAMRGVEPIGEAEVPGRVRGRPLRGRRGPSADSPGALEIDRIGDRIEGLAPGVARRELDRLRRGEIPVDERLDLHGCKEREARAAVREALMGLWQREDRCLLVIHGRGLRSTGRPVLKEALPDWLLEPPWAGRVRALVSADPARGGSGATLVLLHRPGRRPG